MRRGGSRGPRWLPWVSRISFPPSFCEGVGLTRAAPPRGHRDARRAARARRGHLARRPAPPSSCRLSSRLSLVPSLWPMLLVGITQHVSRAIHGYRSGERGGKGGGRLRDDAAAGEAALSLSLCRASPRRSVHSARGPDQGRDAPASSPLAPRRLRPPFSASAPSSSSSPSRPGPLPSAAPSNSPDSVTK